MRRGLRLARWLDAIAEWCGKLTGGLVLLMVAIGAWNVIGRYVGRLIGQNLTSNTLLEAQWYLFSLVFLLGASYALKHDEHVRVDVFYRSWPPRRKALVNFLGTVIFLIPFCVLVIFYSWGWTVNSWAVWEMSPDPGGLPRYPIKSMVIVSFVLLIIQGVAEAIKHWAVWTGAIAPEDDPDALPPGEGV